MTSNRDLARTVSALYGSDWLAHYVYWKVRTDPVYGAVARLLDGSDRSILDVGCGVGVLGFYLRERGLDVPFIGLDLDAEKIDRARRVAAVAGASEFSFDVRVVQELDEIEGHVTLLDVVHYLEDDQQAQLLDSIARRVRPGSRVILRETLADGSWRARITWFEEVFARATGWMRTSTINFPSLEEIDRWFPPDRFDRTVSPLWGRTPFNSHLIEYICR